jgi:hypothetical protein
MPRGPINRLERAIRNYQELDEAEQLAFDKRYNDMKKLRATIRKMAANGLGEKKAAELFPRRRQDQ